VRAWPGLKKCQESHRRSAGAVAALAVVCDFRHWIQYPAVRERAAPTLPGGDRCGFSADQASPVSERAARNQTPLGVTPIGRK